MISKLDEQVRRMVPTRKGDKLRYETPNEYWKRQPPPVDSGVRWATPRQEHDSGRHRGNPDTLHSQMKAWATPRTPTGGPETSERKKQLGRTESGGGDLASQANGKLNPRWVETLMNLPIGWTRPGCADPLHPADQTRDRAEDTTVDNRTDELRLLGNGVVPATAALAFKTLIAEVVATAGGEE